MGRGGEGDRLTRLEGEEREVARAHLVWERGTHPHDEPCTLQEHGPVEEDVNLEDAGQQGARQGEPSRPGMRVTGPSRGVVDRGIGRSRCTAVRERAVDEEGESGEE